MKAVYYNKAMDFSVRETADPVVKDHQVLLKVHSCGVCRTDIHLHHGEFMAGFPLIPGHEFVGEIAAVGKDVTGLSPGTGFVRTIRSCAGIVITAGATSRFTARTFTR